MKNENFCDLHSLFLIWSRPRPSALFCLTHSDRMLSLCLLLGFKLFDCIVSDLSWSSGAQSELPLAWLIVSGLALSLWALLLLLCSLEPTLLNSISGLSMTTNSSDDCSLSASSWAASWDGTLLYIGVTFLMLPGETAMFLMLRFCAFGFPLFSLL